MKDRFVDAVVRKDNVEAEICGQDREKPVHVKGREQVVVLRWFFACLFFLFFMKATLTVKNISQNTEKPIKIISANVVCFGCRNIK